MIARPAQGQEGHQSLRRELRGRCQQLPPQGGGAAEGRTGQVWGWGWGWGWAETAVFDGGFFGSVKTVWGIARLVGEEAFAAGAAWGGWGYKIQGGREKEAAVILQQILPKHQLALVWSTR